MKTVRTAGVNKVEVVEVECPVPGPRDVLVRIRACGICGADVAFLHMDGMPAHAHLDGDMVPVSPGHEPAGEMVEVSSEVSGLKVGDRVVDNPQDTPTGARGRIPSDTEARGPALISTSR
ncbi:alcohol dehydrogenase catalytic domain-containing protein [Streptomyces sp. CG1]|uniref:alcohol dehydrogenase catalytic domain-containing protein n=1 Tax=Streptomyces sp. CG1 TaxID=1287523 RepID=UPI0034E1A470